MRAHGKAQKSALGLILLALLVSTFAITLAPTARVVAVSPAAASCSADDLAFAMPLQGYVITQGLHTTRSYGQKSLDLATFRGDRVVSPINGTVTAKQKDFQGNTAIRIENPCRLVWILHGDWSVEKGQSVQIGNVVGTESNHGYSWAYVRGKRTMCNEDANCGNHVHLDVFDKTTNQWVDPRDLVNRKTVVNESLPTKVENSVTSVTQPGWVDNTVGGFLAWIWRAGTILMVVLALVFMAIAKLFGIRARYSGSLVAAAFLLLAWFLPSMDSWLPSPLGKVNAVIATHYGDVRVDPTGTVTTSWDVQDGQAIYAVSPGVVIPSPVSFSSFFIGDQVWVEVGNNLWQMYQLPKDSKVMVVPGKHLGTGDLVAYAAKGQMSLGVSSKSPSSFVTATDRSYGWMDPENYLGTSVLSGARGSQAIFLGLGIALLIVAWFWPRRLSRDGYPFPWNSRMASVVNYQLVLGLMVLGFGMAYDGPWFVWVGSVVTVLSMVYFIGRLRYRRSPYLNSSMLGYLTIVYTLGAEALFVAFMVIGALAEPDLLFVRRAYALDLPKIVTPELPLWSSMAADDVEPALRPVYNLSDTHAIEPFSFRYWNGSTYRVDIPQEVWDAAVKADKKYHCDAALTLAVAWTESPSFTNHTTENSAGALGTLQFLQGTWNYYYPDPSTRPPRTNIDAAFDAACRKVLNQGLTQASDRATFVDRFAHHALKESIWNADDRQANTVYDLRAEFHRRGL